MNRIRTNNELELIFHKLNILKTIKVEAYSGRDLLEKDLAEKRPLRRPRMILEDVVQIGCRSLNWKFRLEETSIR